MGVLAAFAAAALVVPGLATGMLFLAPALLLLAALLRGHYVGEATIARLVARRRPRCRAGRAGSRYLPRARRAAVLAVPRGGSLVAWSLAVRPPPAPAACA
jgi:UPF0716 family protein affecting phage T7 exclusion